MIVFEQPVPAFNDHALALIPGDIGERDVHRPRLIAPRDRQRHRFSDAYPFKNPRKIGHVVDRLAIRGGDYVFDVAPGGHSFEAGFRGRRVGINPEDNYPLDTCLRGGGFGRRGDAHTRYWHMTLTDELRRNTIDVIDRYRNAYASEFSRTRYDHFGDADQTAGTVEQGTAGVSGIERDICLDSAGLAVGIVRRSPLMIPDVRVFSKP